jgi:hypothetical protein
MGTSSSLRALSAGHVCHWWTGGIFRRRGHQRRSCLARQSLFRALACDPDPLLTAPFSAGPNSNLPPHAFAAATLSEGGKSLMVLGGITSSCATDSVAHILNIDSSATSWTNASPSSFVRRRGAEAAWIDDGSANGAITVVGGVADTYSCCTSF